MKSLNVICTFAAIVAGANAMLPIVNESVVKMFEEWQSEHGILFDTVKESEERLLTFIQNLEMINEHNQAYARGEVTYDMALNQFGHLSSEEYSSQHLTYQQPDDAEEFTNHAASKPRLGESNGIVTGKWHDWYCKIFPHSKTCEEPLLKSIDWREQGAVTRVENQNYCGSSWVFSVTGAIEGLWKINTGELISLSETQLLACVKGGLGCTGGWMDWGFDYVNQCGGIVSEEYEPYVEYGGSYYFGSCKNGSYYSEHFVASIGGYKTVETNNERDLALAVSRQPVSVAVDADAFQFYHSGILSPKSTECCQHCTKGDLNHGVLAVGYGTDEVSGLDYWIIKNSWGDKWGEKGYVRLVKGQNGECGVATAASYPIAY